MRREGALKGIQRLVGQRVDLILLTLIVIIFGILMSGTIMASGRSNASGEQGSFKYYTNIRVEKGDTLWSIADTYISPEYKDIPEYIDEVKELNQLGPDDIYIGQHLMIPYYSSEFK